VDDQILNLLRKRVQGTSDLKSRSGHDVAFETADGLGKAYINASGHTVLTGTWPGWKTVPMVRFVESLGQNHMP
jgi:hypothetical protein